MERQWFAVEPELVWSAKTHSESERRSANEEPCVEERRKETGSDTPFLRRNNLSFTNRPKELYLGMYS